jgi:hypothetical protein
MNTKELAAKLVGATYNNFVGNDVIFSKELQAEAKKHGLVVVFGASDDLMEFRGAINDELGAHKGVTAYLTSADLLHNDCTDYHCPYFQKMKESGNTIQALWCKEDSYSWTFKTDIPHETFEITEDGEPYCRGIVFALKDIDQSKAENNNISAYILI